MEHRLRLRLLWILLTVVMFLAMVAPVLAEGAIAGG
jgi:hypothetical protein